MDNHELKKINFSQIFPIVENYADRFIDNLKTRNLREAIKMKEYVFLVNYTKCKRLFFLLRIAVMDILK